MNCCSRFHWSIVLLVFSSFWTTASTAADKSTGGDGQIVDSGSFGIYVKGQRVATEKFEIRQSAQGSTTHSELKVEDGSTQIGQVTDLLLDPMGNIRRYTWTETNPGKASAVLEPDGQFLMQHIYKAPGEKPYDQPFLLAPSTVVLDDYFFVHRQLLAWRYLGAGCRLEKGNLECRLGKTQYPIIIPRQHISTLVYLDYLGVDQVNFKGERRGLHRFRLELEDATWYLWLDDAHHLARILMSSQNTEVLRD